MREVTKAWTSAGVTVAGADKTDVWLDVVDQRIVSKCTGMGHVWQLITSQPYYNILADRTNGRGYATVLRPSPVVCLSVRDVLWLNGAS